MSPSRQIPLKFPEDALSFETMDISSSNRAVCAALRNVERWPYHIFCLIGAPGSGVTTLAHAWAEDRGGRFLNAGELDRIRPKGIDEIAREDVAIDDVDLLKHVDSLLMLLSSVERHGTRALLSAHTVPSNWEFQSPDLNSRLKAAPLAEIPAPDEDMMRARLKRAFARSVLVVPKSVEDYLVTRLGLDYSQIEHVAEQLAGASGERALTVPLAREILGENQP